MGFIEGLFVLFPGLHLEVGGDRCSQLCIAPVRFVFRNPHTAADGRRPSDDTEWPLLRLRNFVLAGRSQLQCDLEGICDAFGRAE